ncbi:hypothetical protein [Brevundimonas sp.]|uniref:hypothetical protein n=1 Tax=Brevundimonas sp. TaxID=1871086 RepID=UPI002D431662|nr:hypothetical protein [Brevundimonas sp.]HYD28806.1 hypothetical protein [Brevundimonas sp.]
MRELRLVWPSRAERWRKPAIVLLSVGLHVLVLGYVGFKAFEPPRHYGVEEPHGDPFPFSAIYAEIEPRPLLRGEAARTRDAPPPENRTLSINDAGTSPTDTAGPTGSAEDGEQVAPPSPRPGAPGAPAPPADVGTAAWRVRPETMGDRVGRGLRTSPVGCASPRLLTPAERAICDDRLGERAAAAPPISGTGDPERDARFAREGARALALYEERRRPLRGGVGVVGPQDGPGSNFGMGVAGAHLDPSLRPDSTSNVRTRRDRVREMEED